MKIIKFTHIYVDIDTGEILTKYNAKKNFIKLSTKKKLTNVNKTRTTAELISTHEYTSNRQGKLF